MNNSNISDFKFSISRAEIKDLKKRLRNTRWPDQLVEMEWALGTDIKFLKSICDYWANDFDFHLLVEKVNRYRNIRATFDEITVHAMVAMSSNPDALPLMLMHGWPGSVAEMFDVIDPLREHHHVIVPSIPGYTLSGPTTKYGVGVFEIGDTYRALMNSLGFEKFFIAGGDWGSIIGANMCHRHPDEILGYHSTMLPAFPPAENTFAGVTDDENKLLARAGATMATGSGYQAIQSTKPQSLAYALTDSPAGLAGWIVEKFQAWSDGDVSTAYSKQRLLENISLYWFTETINSSMRLYHEAMGRGVAIFPTEKTNVPTGHAQFPGEIYPVARVWAERLFNVVHWNTYARGGHFAAMESPTEYATDIASFIQTVSNTPPTLG